MTDAGLEGLAALTELQGLDLSGTAVSNQGLEHLAALEQLADLQLGGTRVSDAGMKHIARLSRLGFLGIAGTHVTPLGMVDLAGVRTLQRLDVSGTHVRGADVLRTGGFDGLVSLAAADVTWTDVPAAREAWRREQAESRRRSEMQALAAIENAQERRRMRLEVLGLLFIVALFAMFAMQSRIAGLSGWLTLAALAAPPIAAWWLKSARPSYREAFWAGALLGGLVLTVVILTTWHAPPLEAIDPGGPAVSLVVVAAFALALAWPIRTARPGWGEILIVGLLTGAAVVIASPVHSPPDEALMRFWLQYGLNGVEVLVLVVLWVWVTFTAGRLAVAQLAGRPGSRSRQRVGASRAG